MCLDDWSGRDEYLMYNDCHIWSPFYTIIDIICLIHAILNLMLAIKRVAQASSFLPQVILSGAVLLIFAYGTRVATGWTLGDRNLVLNLLWGLGFGCYWLAIVRVVFNYLKTVLLTEKIRGKTEMYLSQATMLFDFLMIIAMASEVGIVALPCLVASLVFFPTYIIFNLGRGLFLTGMFLYYGLVIRKILNHMEFSRTFYQKLRRKLDLVLIPWVIFMVLGAVLGILAIKLPWAVRNQYIVSVFTPISFQCIGTLILFAARSKQYQGGEVESVTNTAMSKSDRKDSSAHGSPTHSTSEAPASASAPYRTTATSTPHYSPFSTPKSTPLPNRSLLLGNDPQHPGYSPGSELVRLKDIAEMEPFQLDQKNNNHNNNTDRTTTPGGEDMVLEGELSGRVGESFILLPSQEVHPNIGDVLMSSASNLIQEEAIQNQNEPTKEQELSQNPTI